MERGSYGGQGVGKEALVGEYGMPCNWPHMVWDGGRGRRGGGGGVSEEDWHLIPNHKRKTEMKSYGLRVGQVRKNDWKK